MSNSFEILQPSSLANLVGCNRILYVKPVSQEETIGLPDIALVNPSFTPFGIRPKTEIRVICAVGQTMRQYRDREWANSPDTIHETGKDVPSNCDGFYSLKSPRRGWAGILDRMRGQRIYELFIATEAASKAIKVKVTENTRKQKYWNQYGYPYSMTVEDAS